MNPGAVDPANRARCRPRFRAPPCAPQEGEGHQKLPTSAASRPRRPHLSVRGMER